MTDDDRKLARVAVATGFLVIATFVAGKAARDATVLANFDIKMLPTFVGVGAFVTIPIVLIVGRRLATKGPAWLFPRINTSSATLLVIEWFLLPSKAAAAVTYVHLAALGPVLVSGFWSTINERLDPRAVKRSIASVGLGTTLGGVAGGLVAQLVASTLPASSILLVVAGLQVMSAVFLARLGRHAVHATPDPNPSIWNGTRAIARSTLLRNVATLIILGAMGAAALDYVFKADLVRAGAPLKGLALYYTITSVITALVQLVATDKTIARLGAAGSAVALPITVAGFAGVMLAIPSAAIASIGRGAELVVRSSIYRASYELLFAPLPPAEKRPAKVVLDVGAERVGDILGSQLISLLLFGMPLARSSIVIAALVLGVLGIGAALNLRRTYIAALEHSLLAAHPTPPQMLTTLPPTGGRVRPIVPTLVTSSSRDAIADLVAELRSGDRDRVTAALATPLVPELVAHVLPLLAWEPVSELATSALRAIAPRVTGVLVDALLDPDTDFTVRRRLPAILEAGDPERAQWGLWHALANERFEVRYRAGKALGRLHEAGVRLTAKPDEIYDAIVREVSVDVRIWRSRSLLDGYEGPESEMRLYRALEERSATALDHVFTLLGLVLPAQPLKVALAALSTDNLALHGTALEYLESVLPPRIRVPLWPFLELEANTTPSPRQPHDVVAALEAHPSILAYLEDPDDPGN